MLVDAGLGVRFWGEADMTAIYIKNRSPTVAVPNATPEELWTGSKVDLSHLRVLVVRPSPIYLIVIDANLTLSLGN